MRPIGIQGGPRVAEEEVLPQMLSLTQGSSIQVWRDSSITNGNFRNKKKKKAYGFYWQAEYVEKFVYSSSQAWNITENK